MLEWPGRPLPKPQTLKPQTPRVAPTAESVETVLPFNPENLNSAFLRQRRLSKTKFLQMAGPSAREACFRSGVLRRRDCTGYV